MSAKRLSTLVSDVEKMRHSLPPTFGQFLRATREVRSLTVRALAAAIGVSPSVISRLEHDRDAPSERVLCAVSAALDADQDEIFIAANRLPPGISIRRAVELCRKDPEHKKILQRELLERGARQFIDAAARG